MFITTKAAQSVKLVGNELNNFAKPKQVMSEQALTTITRNSDIM